MILHFFNTWMKEILELKTLKGLALHDILTEVHLLVHRGKEHARGEKSHVFISFFNLSTTAQKPPFFYANI